VTGAGRPKAHRMTETRYNGITMHKTGAPIWIAALLFTGLLAGPASLSAQAATQPGNSDRGRSVFNGKGICYYCHGMDGRLDQRPKLSRDAADVVARLAPNPPSLRDPKALKLKSDRERFRIVREGHTGTGMLPDASLTDQEITDTLAYLATLRRQ